MEDEQKGAKKAATRTTERRKRPRQAVESCQEQLARIKRRLSERDSTVQKAVTGVYVLLLTGCAGLLIKWLEAWVNATMPKP